LLAYQTAWLKQHYPAEFMAAVLSADMDHTDKVVISKEECDQMGLAVLPPDINNSVHAFHAVSSTEIRYGLGAIKGVGESAVAALVAERAANGPFASLPDLCRRLDLGKFNRRVFEALIRSGALDGLAAHRGVLLAQLPAALLLGEQNTRASAAGQVDLFGLVEGKSTAATSAGIAVGSVAGSVDAEDWSEAERLAGERETLGLYLSGHPLARYERDLPRFVTHRIADINIERATPAASGERGFYQARSATLAGYVHEIRKRGPRMSVLLDDRSGRIEVMFSDEIFQQYRERLVKDAIVLVDGSLRYDEFAAGWRLTARRVDELDRLREQQAQRLLLVWPHEANEKLLQRLAALLKPWRSGGRCAVTMRYRGPQGMADLDFGDDWRVRANRQLLDQLGGVFGSDGVRLKFGPPAGSSSSALG
jgi:DNA polymerase-3 subunit alpha